MQSHMSTPGNSNIIFLLLCDLHSCTPLTSLMALFSYSLKCLLSYIACVFTCHCLRPPDADAENGKSKQYYMSSHIMKFDSGMLCLDFHQLVFGAGAADRRCGCHFLLRETSIEHSEARLFAGGSDGELHFSFRWIRINLYKPPRMYLEIEKKCWRVSSRIISVWKKHLFVSHCCIYVVATPAAGLCRPVSTQILLIIMFLLD